MKKKTGPQLHRQAWLEDCVMGELKKKQIKATYPPKNAHWKINERTCANVEILVTKKRKQATIKNHI